MPHASPGGDEPLRRGDAHGYSPDGGQAGGLVEAEGEVGALERLARRALHEVVDGGERDDPAGAVVDAAP